MPADTTCRALTMLHGSLGMSLLFCDQMALYEANPNKGM